MQGRDGWDLTLSCVRKRAGECRVVAVALAYMRCGATLSLGVSSRGRVAQQLHVGIMWSYLITDQHHLPDWELGEANFGPCSRMPTAEISQRATSFASSVLQSDGYASHGSVMIPSLFLIMSRLLCRRTFL